MKIRYDSNNSGGSWWLTDQNWKDLEAIGWHVDWRKDAEGNPIRWLDALATSATREGLSKDEAIAEFERVTGCDSTDEGCSCCGEPHYFSPED